MYTYIHINVLLPLSLLVLFCLFMCMCVREYIHINGSALWTFSSIFRGICGSVHVNAQLLPLTCNKRMCDILKPSPQLTQHFERVYGHTCYTSYPTSTCLCVCLRSTRAIKHTLCLQRLPAVSHIHNNHSASSLTFVVIINSASPPRSTRCFTTSRCPFKLAM